MTFVKRNNSSLIAISRASAVVLAASALLLPRLTKGETIVFGAIGDFGVGAADPRTASSVARLVKSFDPDFIITLGDNNYFSGEASTIDPNIGQFYHEYIHSYTGSYGAGATSNRFFPCLGNHDLGPNGDFKPYLDYFTLPGNERYYNYQRGPVEFFVLEIIGAGTTANLTNQAEWLQAALGASTATWKLVYFHAPPYSSGNYAGLPSPRWPYREWGASAVLSGHDHNYQRIHTNGLVYFVNGLGGAGPYHFFRPDPGNGMRYSADLGAMRIAATESNVIFNFITRSNFLIDSYILGDPVGAPAILTTLLPQVVSAGADATFPVAVVAASSLQYAWHFNGEAIPGATNALLTLPSVQNEDAGEYSVMVNDGTQSVTSGSALLHVVPVSVWGYQDGLVAELTNVVAATASRITFGNSEEHKLIGLGLTGGGSVVAWNAYMGTNVAVPEGLSNIVAVSQGTNEFLALSDEGRVHRWRYNGGTPTNLPTELHDIAAIASGSFHHLALRRDGRVVAWGINNPVVSNVPADLSNAVAIAVANFHALALRADGSVTAWGGLTSIPERITNAVAIAAGPSSSGVSLMRDGSVQAWGGPGASVYTNVPVGISNIVAISAGINRIFAINSAGRPAVWGNPGLNTNLTNMPPHFTNASLRSIVAGVQYNVAVARTESDEITLEIHSPLVAENGVQVSVQTRRGSYYYLEWTDSLDSGRWTISQPVAGNSQIKTLSDATAGTAHQRFYRIRIQN